MPFEYNDDGWLEILAPLAFADRKLEKGARPFGRDPLLLPRA
jgi:hypothetical protein